MDVMSLRLQVRLVDFVYKMFPSRERMLKRCRVRNETKKRITEPAKFMGKEESVRWEKQSDTNRLGSERNDKASQCPRGISKRDRERSRHLRLEKEEPGRSCGEKDRHPRPGS